MKRFYVSPQQEVDFCEVTEMLAASLLIDESTVDGGDALVKNEWDIFADEDDKVGE